eukprot:scaffold5260_cov242-Pinguiococcus_pyrenoidosus.AAC.5
MDDGCGAGSTFADRRSIISRSCVESENRGNFSFPHHTHTSPVRDRRCQSNHHPRTTIGSPGNRNASLLQKDREGQKDQQYARQVSRISELLIDTVLAWNLCNVPIPNPKKPESLNPRSPKTQTQTQTQTQKQEGGR